MAGKSSRTLSASISTGAGARSYVKGVSTYSPPAQTGGNGMAQLGKALSLTGSIVDRKAKLDNEADKQRGLIQGLTMSAAGDPAKIRSGEMFPQESAAFMAGLKESQSKAWAYQQMTGWQSEYDQWEGKNSNDPNDFQEWLGGKLGDARSAIGDDQFAIAGAMPVLQQAMNNMTTSHAAHTKNRVLAEETQAMRDIVGGMAQNVNTTNPSHPSFDPEGENFMSAVDNEVAIRVRKGLDGTKAKQQVLDDLLNRADATDNEELYTMIANAHDKGIFKLNPDQMKQVEDAHHDYENEMDAIAADEAKAQAAAKKAAENAALGEYTAEIGVDGEYPLPPEGLKRGNPDLYKSMLSMRSAMLKAKDYVDPRQEQASMTKIWGTVYSDKFQKMSKANQIATISQMINTDPEIALSEGTVGSLMREIGKDGSTPKVISQNATYKTLHTATIKTVKAAFDTKADMFGEGGDNRLSAAFEGTMAQLAADLPVPANPTEAKKMYNELAEAATEQLLIDNPDLYARLTEIDAETGRMVTQLPPMSPIYKAVQDMREIETAQIAKQQAEIAAANEAAAAELTALLGANTSGDVTPTGEAPTAPAVMPEVPADLTTVSNEDLANLVQQMIDASRQ